MEADRPTEEDPDEGPDCPDCETTTAVWTNQLSDDEYTTIISCPNCGFQIESQSNIVQDEKRG